MALLTGVALLALGGAVGLALMELAGSHPEMSSIATWGPVMPDQSFEPSVVLVQFDHQLSAVDQERFELRYSLRLESVDGSGTYRFRVLDGVNAAWKADSVRRGTDDGQIWAGTTADAPPTRGLDVVLAVALMLGLAFIAGGAGLWWYRRQSISAESAKPSRRGAARRAGPPPRR